MPEKMPSLEKNKEAKSEALDIEAKKETKARLLDPEIREFFENHGKEIYENYKPVDEAKEKYYSILDSIENALNYLRSGKKPSEERRRELVKQNIKEDAALARKALQNWIDAEISFQEKYRPEIKQYILREQEKALYAGKTKEEINKEKEGMTRRNLRYNLLEMKMHIADAPLRKTPPAELEEIPELEGYFPEENK